MAADMNDLAVRLLAGDPGALARAISLVENDADEAAGLLREVAPRTGRALRIGVTGPPGVGKSTLIDAAAEAESAAGRRVMILAVDPTSPFTGGALLGDRVRMGRAAERGAVFIRSMATRGFAGGVARAAADAMDLLDAAGAERVFLESVGAGQAELEVARCTDFCWVLVSPETGDGIQAMKAGLMEIADILVINKADRPGADRLEHEVRGAFALSTRGQREVPILRTEAAGGVGVEPLVALTHERIEARRASGEFEQRRADNAERRVRSLAEHLVRRRLWADGASMKELLAAVAQRRLSTQEAAERLVRERFGP
jgi:LAO/AO transport system kinase